MENRIATAVRVLLGRPIVGTMIDGAMLLDRKPRSGSDHAEMPPFDLAFGGVVANGPPEKIVANDRFRVCVFPETWADERGKPRRWLTLELRDGEKWHHLITMHESRLEIMRIVLSAVASYLREGRQAPSPTIPVSVPSDPWSTVNRGRSIPGPATS